MRTFVCGWVVVAMVAWMTVGFADQTALRADDGADKSARAGDKAQEGKDKGKDKQKSESDEGEVKDDTTENVE